MAGRSSSAADLEQVAGLRELAASPARGKADRARAAPLTLAGWTAGEAFGVGEDPVRALLAAPVQDRPNWTLPRLRVGI